MNGRDTNDSDQPQIEPLRNALVFQNDAACLLA